MTDLNGSEFPTNEEQGGLSSDVGSQSQALDVDVSQTDEDGGTGEAGFSRPPDDTASEADHDVTDKETDRAP
ncbi:hypothetical protein MF271_06670 [Deinococcus sp. KNUC1210]|uniref:hypothetical protein n=1 Tax=Deinococcus sp. KNUC1210 TaxID=2917691 RepID=UPI001EF04FF1|nr:hypothetical protein [Deinococcus sp. KNUC1210]ULH16285.1 hypothetical protein MF271_06670 [Deinococcus sp. KNUC1210]